MLFRALIANPVGRIMYQYVGYLLAKKHLWVTQVDFSEKLPGLNPFFGTQYCRRKNQPLR